MIMKDEGVETIGVEWDDATRATRAAAGLLTTDVKDVAALGPCDPSVVEATVLTGGPPASRSPWQEAARVTRPWKT